MKNCGMEKCSFIHENSNLTYRINFDILMFSISRIFVVRMKRYKEISLSLSSLRISYFEIIFVRNKDKKLWHGKMLRKVRRKFESKSYVSNKFRYPYIFNL